MSKINLFTIPIIGKQLLRCLVKLEHGEKESITYRKYIEQTRAVKIGMYTYGSCFMPYFNNGGYVTIGRYCSFGPDVRYFGADHPIDHAVMSPYFYNKSFSGFNVEDVFRHHLVVGNDVWIGARVTILSSCHSIGNGAVIGAGAVITRDIPPYAIVGGVPAKIIRYRFSEAIRHQLELSEWWELPPDQLYSNCYDKIAFPVKWAQEVKKIKDNY